MAAERKRGRMRTVFCFCLLTTLLAPVLAESPNAHVNAPKFTYSASGTCLASPGGFNSKLEPINSGVAWVTSFTSTGSVDDHGIATEIGQAVDTASFGVGPRMHAPAAHAYNDTLNISMSESADDGSVILHAGMASGTFTAGPYAGRSFNISGFELRRFAHNNGVEVYGSATSPVPQTVSLVGGTNFERVCVLSVSASPRR
jgi:hypothetical protein